MAGVPSANPIMAWGDTPSGAVTFTARGAVGSGASARAETSVDAPMRSVTESWRASQNASGALDVHAPGHAQYTAASVPVATSVPPRVAEYVPAVPGGRAVPIQPTVPAENVSCPLPSWPAGGHPAPPQSPVIVVVKPA